MASPKFLGFEEEKVPDSKRHMISTRLNSAYKWQTHNTVGALEVPSEPTLDVHLEYAKRIVPEKEEKFNEYLKQWDKLHLQSQFIRACNARPVETCCCGMVTNNDETIKTLVPALNKGWVKTVNERLIQANKKFQIDVFLWSWHNATGKAESNILLIRFFERPDAS